MVLKAIPVFSVHCQRHETAIDYRGQPLDTLKWQANTHLSQLHINFSKPK